MHEKESSFEELLEASRAKQLFTRVDDKAFEEAIAAAVAEERAKLTDRQNAANDLLEGKRVSRALRLAKRPGPKKQHWRAKRRWRKQYYREVLVPKERQRKAALLEGDGWGLVHDYWHRTCKEYTLTQEEWMEFVEPGVVGKMFYVNRYDTTKPYTIENLIVRESSTRKVLFDGMEHKLKSLGYML